MSSEGLACTFWVQSCTLLQDCTQNMLHIVHTVYSYVNLLRSKPHRVPWGLLSGKSTYYGSPNHLLLSHFPFLEQDKTFLLM